MPLFSQFAYVVASDADKFERRTPSKPANNSRSSNKCTVNFSFCQSKAWPGQTLWPCMTICLLLVQNFFLVCQETKGNIKDSILISHLSGSEISGLKISRVHWCGRALWTERVSLKSFVHKKIKNVSKCVNRSLSLKFDFFILFWIFVPPDWVLVQSKLVLAWQMAFLQTNICRLGIGEKN